MTKSGFYSLLSSFCFLSLAAQAQTAHLVVKNSLPIQQQAVVEVSYDSILQKVNPGKYEKIILKNAFGQQVSYQVTYDRKFIFDASVRPNGNATFTIEKGTPEPMKRWVYGQIYPERVDDITWENDRGIYRVYGPALQRSGEKAYGIDVWTKNTPELVVRNRYAEALNGTVRQKKLIKAGHPLEGEAVRVATSFHLDHDNGMDCYSVGPSLGCGTPALMSGGKLLYPYCFKDYDILDNGPLRFTLSLTYETKQVGDNAQVTEHRIISLDKGSNFNKMTVWYDGLKKPMDVAAGVVIHSTDKKDMVLGKNFISYTDPTDAPEKHNFQVYTGLLFPNGAQTRFIPYEGQGKGIVGHAVGIVKNLGNNVRFTYYFGSAWSSYDVRTQSEWLLRINETMQGLDHPLTVSIQ